MTRNQYKNFIEKELHALNQKIDLKILQGMDYNDDARRHRMLREQARTLRRRAFLQKAMSLFIF